MQNWNQLYSTEEYYYGTEPNEFFRTFIDSLPPGRILLPAAGEGRNAIYAAEAGWEVDAFDSSPNARDKALRLAKEKGVDLHYSLQDIEAYDCKKDYYDVVALIFLQLPDEQRRIIHKRLINCLKPDGGNMYLIAFSQEQANYSSGGPQDSSYLYTKEELMHDFSELQIDLLQEEEVALKEGLAHHGQGHVVKMMAIRRQLHNESDQLTL